MKTPDGGPAFPTVMSVEIGRSGAFTTRAVDGMSLRDYFAGQAIVGLCGDLLHRKEFNDIADGIIAGGRYATVAYILADAVLKERAK